MQTVKSSVITDQPVAALNRSIYWGFSTRSEDFWLQKLMVEMEKGDIQGQQYKVRYMSSFIHPTGNLLSTFHEPRNTESLQKMLFQTWLSATQMFK